MKTFFAFLIVLIAAFASTSYLHSHYEWVRRTAFVWDTHVITYTYLAFVAIFFLFLITVFKVAK